MNERPFQFEWDEVEANASVGKHGVSFQVARTSFRDPLLLTVADLEHSKTEERWFSIGCARNGAVLSVVYVWSDADPAMAKIRLISARKATQTEIWYYQKSL